MVQYKKGKDNLVVDALSRKVETEVDLATAGPSGFAETAHLIYEDELDSQGGVRLSRGCFVYAFLSFPSLVE